MDFIIKSEDAKNIKSTVDKMKNNIITGLHHSIHNDDPIEQHKFCIDDCVLWCRYKNIAYIF